MWIFPLRHFRAALPRIRVRINVQGYRLTEDIGQAFSFLAAVAAVAAAAAAGGRGPEL